MVCEVLEAKVLSFHCTASARPARSKSWRIVDLMDGLGDVIAVFIENLAVAVERGTEVDLARCEVDGAVDLGVDATKVEHEHIIDEDPNVIISGKLEGHVLAGDLAIDGCRKSVSMVMPR